MYAGVESLLKRLPDTLCTHLALHKPHWSTYTRQTTKMSSHLDIKKLLSVKFIGGPGDMKDITLRNLANFRESPEKFDKKYYEQLSKLNIILVNHYTCLSDLHPAKDSEVFTSLDLGLTKACEGVTNIMKDNQHLKYDIIIEGQPIKQIVLYALTYRVTKKISDFTLNLFLKKYHETREKLQKVQDYVMTVYLIDDADDNYSRLSKRRQPIEVYDCDFVIAYTTVMLSNFINNDDDLFI